MLAAPAVAVEPEREPEFRSPDDLPESCLLRQCREAAERANAAVAELHRQDPAAKAQAAAIADEMRLHATDRENLTQMRMQATVGAEVELRLLSIPVDAADALRQDGVVRLASGLPKELCDRVLAEINATIDRVVAQGGEMMPSTGFGDVQVKQSRYDLFLDNGGVVRQSLSTLLAAPTANSSAKSLLSEVLKLAFGDGPHATAPFRELSSLVSDPGAPRQPIHPDIPWHGYPALYTVFVALQDIDASMGPTVFLPRTNTESAHAAYNGGHKLPFMDRCEYRSAILKQGECVVFDARTLHAGTANESERRRALLYFTLQNPCVPDYTEVQRSIKPGIQLTLGDVWGG